MEDTQPQQEQQPPQRRGPRLYHKKSRFGCERCKQRRVKCDEAKPKCTQCAKHMVSCVYPAVSTTSGAASTKSEPSPPSAVSGSGKLAHIANWHSVVTLSPPEESGMSKSYPSPSLSQPTPDSHAASEPEADGDMPETRERRLLELALLLNQQQRMKEPIPTPEVGALQKLWQEQVPSMAIAEDGALHRIYMAHSALDIALRSDDPKEREKYFQYQSQYLDAGLRLFKRDFESLGPGNADRVCLTGLKILAHVMAQVQTVPVDPWEPPLVWMGLGKRTYGALRAARDLLDENSRMRAFVDSPPSVRDGAQMIQADYSALAWLLEPPSVSGHAELANDHELEDPEVFAAYTQALSYTCCIQLAINRRDPEYGIIRLLGAFSCWCHHRFIALLSERKPRAMVVMAHFMALWLDYESVWLIGKAGERQINGIYAALPPEWRPKVEVLLPRLNQMRVRREVWGVI
ncbi:uncharacterized protein B0I36DRAFT_107159 [Microdochium trichocladiopsis]|uniref:Zn(2)-C6 fungal-type domain-containing protein n=1 Tax=Microdochium trichocladiopsis TaxID=1682393 RepID=A0A9P8Y9K6_9PEZI|nr:uncharacterized protein B0I36DRAFT_107159 [Microdochium trichocladiopsis]KAH7033290.1 hypothetical protein B0I36DRAFT_107159 [Microdochium trichocladiopsis]